MDYTTEESKNHRNRLNDSMESLISSLSAFRISQNISKEQVIDDLGITLEELNTLENPLQSNPSLFSLVCYAHAIGADLEFRVYKHKD